MEKTFGWIGSLLGAMLSWYLNHSVFWAIVGFIFGWIYIVIAVCKHFL